MKRGLYLLLLGGLAVLLLAGLALASEAAGGGDYKTWEFWMRVMNFVVMAVILYLLLRKPLKKFFQGRIEGIQEDLNDLEQRRDEASRQLGEAETRLKQVEEAKESILAQYRALGQREREQILEQAQKSAEYIKEQARFTINQETAKARNELRAEIARLSVQAAEELLKNQITDQDQERLLDEYLAKVPREL